MEEETDKLIDSLKGKNSRERDKEIKSSIGKDLLYLSKILSYMKEKNEAMKKDIPKLSELVNKFKAFYKDLESEGLIKIERELFSVSTKDSIKESNEREIGANSLKEIKELKLTHQQSFKKLNDFYHGVYCFLLKHDLKKIAEKFAGRKLTEGEIIRELEKYKGGKYKDLFDCLNAQIKNSISHKEYLLDQRDPKITYIDKDKPPLKLTLEEFKKICYKLFFLQLSHDITSFELIEEVNFDISKKLEIVNEFIKKYGGKIVEKDKGYSKMNLYDLGKLLESNKDKWNN